MSCVIRKTCENKGADHLRSNRAADQHLCFHFINSIIPLLKLESSFCGRTERFESDLVDYPKDRFSYDATQFRSSSKNQK